MNHPLRWIPQAGRLPAFLFFLFLALGVMLAFQSLDAPLRTAESPAGIVSLELAWSAEKAEAIIASWEARAGLYAAFGLGFDYFFMIAYAVAIALGTLLAAGRHPGRFARLGAWLGIAAILAAVCDAVENMGMSNQLLQGEYGWAPFVSACATAKFILILAGILYGLIGWLWPKAKPRVDDHG